MGGGRKCMIVNCKSSRTDKTNKTSFHEVPVDPKRRKLWFEVLKPYIDPLDQKEVTHVCGKHFEEKCYMNSKRRFLVRDAVPTIFNIDEANVSAGTVGKGGKLTKQKGAKKKQKKEKGGGAEDKEKGGGEEREKGVEGQGEEGREERGGGGESEEDTTIPASSVSEMTLETTPQPMQTEEREETNTSNKYLFDSVQVYHENGSADVCRICFREAYRHKKLTDRHCTRIQSYKEMLEYLAFDINFDFYADPVICLNCIMMLLNAYDFKRKCLKTENTLKKYQSSRISSERTTNILIVGPKRRVDPTCSDEITIEITDSSPPREGRSVVGDHDYGRPASDGARTPPNGRRRERAPPDGDRREPTPPDLKATRPPEIRGDPPYLCQECGRFFLNWRQCRRHLRNHRLQRKTVESFTCEVCKRTFSNVNVDEHMDTHRRKRYKCVHCERQFDKSNLLATHMKANHERSPYVTCDVCGKVCLRKFLTTHVAKHFDEKDAQCPVCGKMFYRWYLQQHEKTHWGKRAAVVVKNKAQTRHEVRNFRCEVCAIAFRTKCELEIHSSRKLHLRNVMLEVVAKASKEKN